MSNPQINTTNPRFGGWRKSTRSGPSQSCVYVSPAVDGSGDVAVADGKAGPGSPIQVYDRAAWTAFVDAVKAGVVA